MSRIFVRAGTRCSILSESGTFLDAPLRNWQGHLGLSEATTSQCPEGFANRYTSLNTIHVPTLHHSVVK